MLKVVIIIDDPLIDDLRERGVRAAALCSEAFRFNTAEIAESFRRIGQAFKVDPVKAEDLRSVLENLKLEKRPTRSAPGKPYYIEQQRRKKGRWSR